MAASGAVTVLNGFLDKVVVQIINPIILLLVAVAFVVFLWGVVDFIMHAGDEAKRAEGQRAIFWGLIGLVIMFGAYGIINIAAGAFNLGPVHKITNTTTQ